MSFGTTRWNWIKLLALFLSFLQVRDEDAGEAFLTEEKEKGAAQRGSHGLKQTNLTLVPREPCWAFEPPGFARTILDTPR